MDALSDLAFFSLVVKHGNLSAAARELGLTPPAVSTRLAKLEQRLGVRLLNRTTRRVSVTQEGELYLAEGGRILADLEALERSVSSARAQPMLAASSNGALSSTSTATCLPRSAARISDLMIELSPDVR